MAISTLDADPVPLRPFAAVGSLLRRVTLNAGEAHMATGERKATHGRVIETLGGSKAGLGVTGLTPERDRALRELSGVRVAMAVGAALAELLKFERFRSGRGGDEARACRRSFEFPMASKTGDRLMCVAKREGEVRVSFDIHARSAESLGLVADPARVIPDRRPTVGVASHVRIRVAA